jgi:hypothetical protein
MLRTRNRNVNRRLKFRTALPRERFQREVRPVDVWRPRGECKVLRAADVRFGRQSQLRTTDLLA